MKALLDTVFFSLLIIFLATMLLYNLDFVPAPFGSYELLGWKDERWLIFVNLTRSVGLFVLFKRISKFYRQTFFLSCNNDRRMNSVMKIPLTNRHLLYMSLGSSVCLGHQISLNKWVLIIICTKKYFFRIELFFNKFIWYVYL